MASASGEISSGKLTDLRVVDLRSELEKRGLDKTGVKAVLLERLEKALKCEEESRKNTKGSEEKSDVAALVKIDTHSEEKNLEENQSTEDIKNEHTTDNMDEKESETSNVALTDVFLNTSNSNGYSLLSDKTSVEDLTEDRLLSSDTKPSDMLTDNTLDKDQFKEELPISLDTDKDTGTVLQEQSDDALKDTTAPPEQSSSSTENNIKEENSEKSSSARVRIATLPLNSNELKDEVVFASLSDSLPPTPTSVPCLAPLTLEDTINMDTSIARKSEENESLILHVDDTQNDLVADIVSSKTNNKAKTDNASKDKVSGKTEVKKTDGSKVEERAKGKNEGGQTEKKADEKKDDKDVKSKSSLVSKPKSPKKGNNQTNRNLWICGFPVNISTKGLVSILSKHGKVEDCQKVTKYYKRSGRCHAFVTMSTEAEALECIMRLNKTRVNGMRLTVERERRLENALQRKLDFKAQEKGRPQQHPSALKLQKNVGKKQEEEEAIRLDMVRKQLRLERMKLEKMKLEKEKLLRSRMEKELLEMENRDVEMRYAEMLRLERMKLEKMKLEKEKFRMEKELLEMERHEEEMRSAELLRFEEMRYSAKRPHDRSGFHDRELWDEHKQSRMRTSGDSSRFELPFQDESRYNTDYGRRIKRYDRRDSRALEGGSRYDDRKEREMMRMEMGPFHNTRVRGEGQIDNRSRNDEEFNWMPSELRRDMGPNGELDRRYIGSDRGYDNDQQNTSANDRLGRNSFGGGPDQRSWDSGGVDRKMDNWSHMHGDIGNSGMNRSNGPWLDKPTNKTGRDATGAFVNSSQSGNSGGMGQYFGHGNMFGNSQVHSGLMVSHRGGGGGI